VSYTLIEPCCGSAALAVHLCGLSDRAFMPYAGSKWRLRKKLADLIEEQGYSGPPDRVVLRDSGPWGATWKALLDDELRPVTFHWLERWAGESPETVYGRLYENPPSAQAAIYAAEYLFLQRFAGKPLREREGFWAAAKYDPEAIYGNPRELIPTLLERLRAFRWGKAARWASERADASTAPLPSIPAVVYLDPPFYAVEDFLPLARRFSDAGCFVAVSSTEPLNTAWKTVLLDDSGRFPQYVTHNDRPGPTPPSSVFDFFG
jgi:hypothetical protein